MAHFLFLETLISLSFFITRQTLLIFFSRSFFFILVFWLLSIPKFYTPSRLNACIYSLDTSTITHLNNNIPISNAYLSFQYICLKVIPIQDPDILYLLLNEIILLSSSFHLVKIILLICLSGLKSRCLLDSFLASHLITNPWANPIGCTFKIYPQHIFFSISLV